MIVPARTCTKEMGGGRRGEGGRREGREEGGRGGGREGGKEVGWEGREGRRREGEERDE